MDLLNLDTPNQQDQQNKSFAKSKDHTHKKI